FPTRRFGRLDCRSLLLVHCCYRHADLHRKIATASRMASQSGGRGCLTAYTRLLVADPLQKAYFRSCSSELHFFTLSERQASLLLQCSQRSEAAKPLPVPG